MATTEKDLDQKRERLARLRQQVAEANAQRVTREEDLSRDVQAAQLDAEAAQLEAQLFAAKEAAKSGTLKARASGPLDTAKEDMRRAAELQKAQEKAAASARDSKSESSEGSTNETKEG